MKLFRPIIFYFYLYPGPQKPNHWNRRKRFLKISIDNKLKCTFLWRKITTKAVWKKRYHASKNIEHRESKTNEWEIENAERRITEPFKSFKKSCVCLFQNQILHIKEYIEPDCGFHIIPRSSNFLWRYHGLINKVYVTHTRFEMILEGLVTQLWTTKELDTVINS